MPHVQGHSSTTSGLFIDQHQQGFVLPRLLRGLKCMQCNLQRSRAATLNIIQIMGQMKADLLMVQEPYTTYGKIIGLPNTSNCFLSGNSLAGIIYEGPLSPTLLLSTEHSVTIILETCNQKLSATSSYFPPSVDIEVPIRELEERLPFPASYGIFAGDYNATSPLWEGRREDARATHMIDFMATNNLIQINESDSPPTFWTTRSEGWPDLTITTALMAPYIQNWRVEDIPTASDHRLITYSIDIPISYLVRKRYKTIYGGHKKFLDCLAPRVPYITVLLNNSYNQQTLDEAYDQLIQTIDVACRTAYKTKAYKSNPRTHWWTQDLQKERSRLRALRRRAQVTQEQALRNLRMQDFRRARAIYKKHIYQAKLSSWRNFCTETTHSYGQASKISMNKVFRPTSLPRIIRPTANSTAE
ncbi:uncharacterized protein LOC118198344 [Stegodyphus dumicola]|uniref:uncharacterized protein LOC118198344 n=1 Tax=Stegodyphus dumicola TaxID=202533 RepID=UPI0015A828CE|nr:uncharacterized protein LOC118198344 [Stegodyphus dumicola]